MNLHKRSYCSTWVPREINMEFAKDSQKICCLIAKNGRLQIKAFRSTPIHIYIYTSDRFSDFQWWANKFRMYSKHVQARNLWVSWASIGIWFVFGGFVWFFCGYFDNGMPDISFKFYLCCNLPILQLIASSNQFFRETTISIYNIYIYTPSASQTWQWQIPRF